MGSGITPRLLWSSAVLLACSSSSAAAADKARIRDLADVAFGTINNLSIDANATQSVCAYSSSDVYSVTASGDGPGGEFVLLGGVSGLPFEVQWSGTAAATTGISLTAGVASSSFSSTQNVNCSGGPSATLIVQIRAAQLQAATAGAYSGTLTILLAPM
jgi:hypothetical protein